MSCIAAFALQSQSVSSRRINLSESILAMRKALLALGIVCTALTAPIFAQQPNDPEPLELGEPRFKVTVPVPEEKKSDDANPFAAIQKLLKQLEARLSALEAKAAPTTVVQGAPDWIGQAQAPAVARDRRAADPFAPQAQAPVMQPAPLTPATSATSATRWEYKTVSADPNDVSGANKWGEQGWELVAVVQPNNTPHDVAMYFKRPLGQGDSVRKVGAAINDFNRTLDEVEAVFKKQDSPIRAWRAPAK